MSALCGTCKHWEHRDYLGEYECDDFDLRYEPENEVPVDLWGECMKVDELRPERSSRFFVTDGSDYTAHLKTRHDFGCVEHEPRPPATSEDPS